MSVGSKTQQEIDNITADIENTKGRISEADESINVLRSQISEKESEFLAMGEEQDREILSLQSTIDFILGTEGTENAHVRVSRDDPARAGIEFEKKSSINPVRLVIGLGVIWFIIKKVRRKK